MAEATRDMYLNEMTDEQAVKAWRRVAIIMLQGGAYEPVGHDQLDGLAATLLRMADEWTKDTVRGWRDDG